MNNYERGFPPESIFIRGRLRRGVVQVGVTRSLLSPHVRPEAGPRLARVCLGGPVQRGHILEWKGTANPPLSTGVPALLLPPRLLLHYIHALFCYLCVFNQA